MQRGVFPSDPGLKGAEVMLEAAVETELRVDPLQFKAGMRRLAAAVCLITSTTSAGEKVGLTATAVCSVSAEPPTLLCC
ncbi:MAG: flavin reductase, partial [Sinobacteraceae bacterium]|nr:flavin reductase [Nevskiaceae bacterium]